MAALLACGPGAYLSHRSAAALLRIGDERDGVVEVSIRRRGEHHRDGVKVRSRPSLPNQDVGTLNRVPVTSPVRTLLDYATLEPPNRVERAVNEADKRDHVDPDQLRKALDRHPGEPGVKRRARSSTSTPSASPTRNWNSSSARSRSRHLSPSS